MPEWSACLLARLYAPFFALIVAGQLGYSLIALSRALLLLSRADGQTLLMTIGAITVALPIMAMAVFTLIALLRLGDWIGPTRRTLGCSKQLSLPL